MSAWQTLQASSPKVELRARLLIMLEGQFRSSGVFAPTIAAESVLVHLEWIFATTSATEIQDWISALHRRAY